MKLIKEKNDLTQEILKNLPKGSYYISHNSDEIIIKESNGDELSPEKSNIIKPLLETKGFKQVI